LAQPWRQKLMDGAEGNAEDWIGHLAGLEDEAESLAFLAARTDLHGRPAVEHLSRELVRYALEDLRQAERLARAVSWLAEAVGDDYCRALAAKSQGHAAYLTGRYEEARAHYHGAVDLFRAGGAEVEAAVVLSSSLQNSTYLGRFREALEDARQAREVFARHGDRLLLARLASNEGNILVRQDRHAEALELFRDALAVLRQIGDPQDLVAVLTNVSVCAIELHDFTAALSAYRELSAHCERHGMALAAAQADYNIAYFYYHRGEFTRALEMYQRSRAWSLEAGDSYALALCDLDQAEIYLELNLTEEGERLAQLAFAAFEELAMPYEGAKTVAFLAIAAHQLGRDFQALRLFDDARRRFVAQENRVWPAAIDLYQALILYDAGRSPEARHLAERSQELFQDARQEARAALCDVLLARIDLQMSQPLAARDRCRLALQRLEALDIPASSAKAWFVRGQAEEALGDREAALAAYRTSHGLLESLRTHLHREELKISFFRDKLELYQSLVAITLSGEAASGHQRQEQRDALTFIEQAKSRSLADLIAFRAQSLPPSRSTQSELVDRMRRLREELNWYYRQIDVHELQAPPGPEGGSAAPRSRIEELRRLSREQESKLLATLGELRTADAEFGSLQTAATLDVDEIQAAIPPDCMLIEYYEARGTIYVALVGRSQLTVRPITTGLRVREVQRLLQFQLSKFRLGTDYCRTFADQIHAATRAHLSELYAELLAPVAELFEKYRHLVVIPHGSLHYLPFHALHDGERYLIDRFTLSYAPSASVFALCCGREDAGGLSSLILGVPDRLTPSILDEVRAVAAMLPDSELLLAEEATEERLRALGPAARLVHIATHGFFRQDNPMFSAIQLGGSRLTLFDIYQLELDSDLVVLSGCGTGLNVVESGDELIGLTRGLLYAGAHAAMVTLWDVHDRSTADFMSAFYRQLSRQPNLALAARVAMQELREVYPHPYYWAPFVLVGKPFEIKPRGSGGSVLDFARRS
jgi:CHAT domain-containing protein/tetratricopeptide (TPR) repeat protein